MKNSKHIFIVALFATLFAACEKEEKLWTLPAPGSEKITSFSMGETYENTTYFQLSTGNITQRYLFLWDLAFAADSNAQHLVVNGGKEVQVHTTTDTDFSKNQTAPDEWNWDNPNGSLDSTAFGNCFNSNRTSKQLIYIVDIGKQYSPRYYKLQLLTVTDSTYRFKLGELNDAVGNTFAIRKDHQKNYTYFNLDLKEVVDYEPNSTEWDLVFTRYRYVYYNMTPITPYQVNGALINTKQVTVAQTTTIPFEELDIIKAQQLMLTKKQDEIGYDWKYFDLNGSGKYLVNMNKIFVVKTADGYYYKIRFLDFYDDKGAKGVPKMAYQRL